MPAFIKMWVITFNEVVKQKLSEHISGAYAKYSGQKPWGKVKRFKFPAENGIFASLQQAPLEDPDLSGNDEGCSATPYRHGGIYETITFNLMKDVL